MQNTLITNLTIFYDNHCPKCTRFANLILKLDWLSLIQTKQLRNPSHINIAIGINKKLAEKQMASFDGSWSYGYKTLFKIFLRIPLFWILLPLFWLLKISNLGQYLYIQLAINRQIIPIHCTEESCELK